MATVMLLLHHAENLCCMPWGVVGKEFRILQSING